MNVSKNDLFYILLSVILAAIGVVAVSNPNNQLGLYGLLGLLGIAVVMAIIIKPSLGANILVIFIFTNVSDLLTKQGYGSTGIIKPLVAVVALALVVRYAYVGQVPIGHSKTARVEYFLLIYFLVVIASYLVAADKSRAIADITDMGKDLVIVYCILFALRTPETWKQTTWLMIITTTVLCLLSVYQLLTNNFDQTFFRLADIQMDQALATSATARVAGPINAPNLWAQVLIAISTIVLFRVIHEKSMWVRFLSLLIAVIMLYVVLNTYSRGAYLVLAIDLILIFFVFEKRFNFILALGVVGILIVVFAALPVTYRERFNSLFLVTSQGGIYQDTSLRGRSSEILTGLAMFAEHPILGVGAANYPVNYQQYAQKIGLEFRTTARDPHSLYVQVLAETGILGAIAFFGLVISLFLALNRTIRDITRSGRLRDWLPWMNAIRMALLSYLMTSVFLHNAYFRYFWLLLAMALAGIQVTYSMLNSTERTTYTEAWR